MKKFTACFLIYVFLAISGFLLYGSHSITITPAESFEFSDESESTQAADESESIHVVRDSQTILLAGQVIPPKDYIHLYDASPYKIVNGHLATKIPCDQSFQPQLYVLVGQAPKLQNIQLHLIEELSTAGKLCIYHSDLEEISRVTHTTPGIHIGTLTDIAIQNPGTEAIDMPPTSTIVIGVNEIQSGAGEIEH